MFGVVDPAPGFPDLGGFALQVLGTCVVAGFSRSHIEFSPVLPLRLWRIDRPVFFLPAAHLPLTVFPVPRPCFFLTVLRRNEPLLLHFFRNRSLGYRFLPRDFVA